MARHRDFRTFNRQDHDFDDDDDDYPGYGQSYEDDQYGASPTTRQQYTYNYEGRHVISDLFPHDKDYVIDEKDFEDNQPPVEQPFDGSNRQSIDPDPGGSASASMNPKGSFSIPINLSSGNNSPNPNAPKPQRQPRAGRRSRAIGETGTSDMSSKTPVKLVEPPVANVGKSSEVDSLNFQFEDLCSDWKQGKDDINIKQTNESLVIPDQGARRQSSPVLRTGQGFNDSSKMPARTTRVAQLASAEGRTSPAPSPSSGRSNNSRPSSGANGRGGQSPGRTPRDATKKKEAEKAKIAAAHEKRCSSKPVINLVVVGHVDAGKSTLMGHVLHMIEPTCETRSGRPVMNDSRNVSNSDEDRPIPFAWNLDETDTERDRGVTIDVAQTCFETEHRSVVLLDAPGHKDFIPNMISGAAQADVALLVVNGTRGEFETGFDAGGQTREHAMLVRSLGVHQLIVAINKMDTVNWSKERYDTVIKKSRPFLKNVKFTNIQFVPVSGLYGINLMDKSSSKLTSLQIPPIPDELSSWYKGPSLLEVIDHLQVPERQIDKPFRFCVSDFFRIPNSTGVTVSGMVVSGGVLNGNRVLCKPAGFSATVKSISIAAAGSSSSEGAFAGDLCTLHLTGANVDMSLISSGNVVCDADSPILSTNKFEARILLLTKEASIARGAAVMFHLQNISETAIVLRLLRIVDRGSGELKTRNPRVLNNSCCADVEIQLEKCVCLELYRDFRELGRFTLRREGKSIASGTITKLYREDGVTFG